MPGLSAPHAPPPPPPRPPLLAAVLPAGHPDRPDPAAGRGTPSTLLTAAGLVAGALAAGAGLAFLGGVSATLGAAALTLLFGALWVQAARAHRRASQHLVPARGTPAPGTPAPASRPLATAHTVAGRGRRLLVQQGFAYGGRHVVRSHPRRPARSARTRFALAATATALVLALAVPARRAEAQRSPDALSRLSFGAGADARGAAAGEGGGRTLLLGYDVWRGGGVLPVTVRATGSFLDRVGRGGGPTRFGGVGVDAAVSLRESGLIRPYLVAGVGVYRLSGIDGPAGVVEPARTAPAVLGGAGLRVPIGSVSAFVEARYTTFRGAAAGGYTPVVLGIRF